MSEKEVDEFWDIGKLVPKRSRRRVGFDVSAHELSSPLSDDGNQNADESLRLNIRDKKASGSERLLCEYSPDNAFVRKVSIYSTGSAYRYYEDFEQTMHKYLRLTVKSAERVPFFSYVPQYSQLSGQRLAWYLYWRSNCRRRVYLPTDFSYVLLYVYELINFHNPKYPDRIAEELCSLWMAYREEFCQLDKYLPDWVGDYCLIHQIDIPMNIISDVLDEVIGSASLREFYLGSGGGSGDSYVRALMQRASGYNYRKSSKYYTAENKALFDAHVYKAAAEATGMDLDSLVREGGGGGTVLLERDAFDGALCTSGARRRICVEYYPLYRLGPGRTEATLAVKYAENKLRAVLGVRSRLSAQGLSRRSMEAIDAYFWREFGTRSANGGKDTTPPEPDYMSYYDSIGEGVGYERAQQIETESWDTAILMSEAFEDDEAAEVETTEQNSPQREDALPEAFFGAELYTFGGAPQTDNGEDAMGVLLDSLSEKDREVLSLLAQKRPKEAAGAAMASGSFISDVCERINESALNMTGDVLIECGDGEYYILEDYENEVKKWLRI